MQDIHAVDVNRTVLASHERPSMGIRVKHVAAAIQNEDGATQCVECTVEDQVGAPSAHHGAIYLYSPHHMWGQEPQLATVGLVVLWLDKSVRRVGLVVEQGDLRVIASHAE